MQEGQRMMGRVDASTNLTHHAPRQDVRASNDECEVLSKTNRAAEVFFQKAEETAPYCNAPPRSHTCGEQQ